MHKSTKLEPLPDCQACAKSGGNCHYCFRRSPIIATEIIEAPKQTPAEQSWRADIRERAVKPPCFELRRETLRHEVTAEMDRIAARTIARLEGQS